MTTWTTWIALGALILLLLAIGIGIWWIWNKQKRKVARAETSSELKSIVERLGLGDVWQAPMYQADVFGFVGIVNGFSLRGELWDNSVHDFFRLTLRFPKPLRQGLSLSRNQSLVTGLLHRGGPLSVGDTRFDEAFQLFYSEGEDELARGRELFSESLRERLVSLGEKVDELKIGDKSFHLFVEGSVESQVIERLIRESLRISVDLYNRAVEVGPVKTVRNTEYEMIAYGTLGRETEGGQESPLPEGESTEEGFSGDADSSTPTARIDVSSGSGTSSSSSL